MDEEIMGKIFYKNTAAIIYLLIAMFCFNGSSLADMREAELFEKAYEYYLAFNPEKALETFDLFLQQYPDSTALDSILFWRAKSLMQMKRIEEAAKGFRRLREVFPDSSYSLFAEKELEALKNMLPKVDKSEPVREKTVKTSDAKIPAYEDRIRKLETEKIDLEKQLSDAEKKRQFTEKGLSKALDDKNDVESQLQELKKSREDLVRRTAALEKGARESTGLTDEKRALELRLKASEEKSGSLSAEIARSDEKIAAVTRELSAKVQQAQKDRETIDLQIKDLKAQNSGLGNTVKEKDKAIADFQQTLLSVKQNEAELAKAQAESAGLQSRIKTLEARDLERKDLAARAEEAEKLRGEAAHTAAELAKLQKENSRLIEENKALGVRMGEIEEKTKAQSVSVKDLNDKAARSAQEMASLVEELNKERKKAADLSARNSESEAALLKEIKTLEKVRKELEISDRGKNELAGQIAEAKNIREEFAGRISQAEIIEKDNKRLLEEKRGLEQRLREADEKMTAMLSRAEGDKDREIKAFSEKLREADKRQKDADLALKKSYEEKQAAEVRIQEQQARITKSQESIALLENTIKGSEQEKEKKIHELNERIRITEAEKKGLEEGLERERKQNAELSGKGTEKETALLNDVKTLERSRIDLEARLAEEKTRRESDFRKFEAERADMQARLKDLEPRAMKTKDVVAQLEESRKKQEELAKVSALNEKELATLRAEKTELTARFRDTEDKIKALSGIKQRDERAATEKQDLERKLSEKDSQLAKALESMALLQNSLKESENDKAMAVIAAQNNIRKGSEEKKALEEELKKERASATALSGRKAEYEAAIKKELIASETSRRELEQKLTEERARLSSETQHIRSERDELNKQLQVAASLRKEKEELVTRLDDQERKSRDQQSQISKLAIEKEALERQLKETGEVIAAMKPIKEDRALLQAAVDQMKTQKQQMQTELAELKRIHEQQATRNTELTGEVSALRTQFRDYEKPFLRIGKERYTLAAVMREGMISKSVSDKIQAKSVPWRTGNIIDDFIAEQVLARKAEEETLSADTSVKESLVKQYALTAPEGAYLAKYLAIDGLVKKRLAPAITENEAREYYEKHKVQYVHGRENRIRVISVKYGKADELEKSLIAVEILQEVQAGRTFDAIAKSRAAFTATKEMSLSGLPDWARVKIAGLKEGEISNIISVDNEFMIIQAIPSKPTFRSFEEVRKEIVKKLSAEQPGRKESLQDWLNSLKKDAEFLR